MEYFRFMAYSTKEEFHEKLNTIIEEFVEDIHSIIEKASIAENKVMKDSRLSAGKNRVKLERNRKVKYEKMLKAYGECEMSLYEVVVHTEKEFTKLFEQRKTMVSGPDKHFVYLHYNNACYEMQKLYEEKIKEAGTIYRKLVFSLNKFAGDGINE